MIRRGTISSLWVSVDASFGSSSVPTLSLAETRYKLTTKSQVMRIFELENIKYTDSKFHRNIVSAAGLRSGFDLMSDLNVATFVGNSPNVLVPTPNFSGLPPSFCTSSELYCTSSEL